MRIKKSLVGIVLIVLAFGSIGYKVYSTQKEKKASLFALMRENVEALASGESGEFEYPTGQPYQFQCGVKVGIGQFCKATVIVCQGGGSGCNSRKCPQHG